MPNPEPSFETEKEVLPVIAGIVLCGGDSIRMGSPKWSTLLAGKTMLERVLDSLAGTSLQVLSVASDGLPLPSFAGVACIHDSMPNRGPVEGIRCSVNHLALHSTAEFVVVTSCDVPLLTQHVVQQLVQALVNSSDDAVVARSEDRIHPTIAAYRLKPLNRLLSNEQCELTRLHEIVSRLRSRFEDVDSVAVMNVNTPEELQAAAGLLDR